jgi:putative ABC transport system permease protein
MLRKSPGFTAVAVLVLAVGIGANTAIFSFVDAVLLRPLPYANADRLVFIRDNYPQIGAVPISYPQYLYWKDQHQLFDHVITQYDGTAALTGSGEPEQISTSMSPPMGIVAHRCFQMAFKTYSNLFIAA